LSLRKFKPKLQNLKKEVFFETPFMQAHQRSINFLSLDKGVSTNYEYQVGLAGPSNYEKDQAQVNSLIESRSSYSCYISTKWGWINEAKSWKQPHNYCLKSKCVSINETKSWWISPKLIVSETTCGINLVDWSLDCASTQAKVFYTGTNPASIHPVQPSAVKHSAPIR
jgi:hypothetical protein